MDFRTKGSETEVAHLGQERTSKTPQTLGPRSLLVFLCPATILSITRLWCMYLKVEKGHLYFEEEGGKGKVTGSDRALSNGHLLGEEIRYSSKAIVIVLYTLK